MCRVIPDLGIYKILILIRIGFYLRSQGWDLSVLTTYQIVSIPLAPSSIIGLLAYFLKKPSFFPISKLLYLLCSSPKYLITVFLPLEWKPYECPYLSFLVHGCVTRTALIDILWNCSEAVVPTLDFTSNGTWSNTGFLCCHKRTFKTNRLNYNLLSLAFHWRTHMLI